MSYVTCHMSLQLMYSSNAIFQPTFKKLIFNFSVEVFHISSFICVYMNHAINYGVWYIWQVIYTYDIKPFLDAGTPNSVVCSGGFLGNGGGDADQESTNQKPRLRLDTNRNDVFIRDWQPCSRYTCT